MESIGRILKSSQNEWQTEELNRDQGSAVGPREQEGLIQPECHGFPAFQSFLLKIQIPDWGRAVG